MEQAFKLESVKRYIDNKEAEDLLDCLEHLEPQAVVIGEGKNAEVFGLDEGRFKSVCMKKIREQPELKCNDLDTEVDFQNRVRELGIKTPLTFAYIELKEDNKKEEMILMERIFGCSLGDIILDDAQVPDNYDHRTFFAKLKEQVRVMHEANIHHRDLHEGNVMIDEKGEPVIIDFGTACTSFSGDDHPYGEQVRLLNKTTGRYEFASGYFKDDERMLYQLEVKMRPFARNKGIY